MNTIEIWKNKKVPIYRTIYNIEVTKDYYFTTDEGLKRIKCPECKSLKETAKSYGHLCINCLKNNSLRNTRVDYEQTPKKKSSKQKRWQVCLWKNKRENAN